MVDVYKKYDKKLTNNNCQSKNEENVEDQQGEDSNESEADLLFLIQAPSGSAIRIPVEQYNQAVKLSQSDP